MLGRWDPTNHKGINNLNISIMSMPYKLRENLHLSMTQFLPGIWDRGKSQTLETSCSACKNCE